MILNDPLIEYYHYSRSLAAYSGELFKDFSRAVRVVPASLPGWPAAQRPALSAAVRRCWRSSLLTWLLTGSHPCHDTAPVEADVEEDVGDGPCTLALVLTVQCAMASGGAIFSAWRSCRAGACPWSSTSVSQASEVIMTVWSGFRADDVECDRTACGRAGRVRAGWRRRGSTGGSEAVEADLLHRPVRSHPE